MFRFFEEADARKRPFFVFIDAVLAAPRRAVGEPAGIQAPKCGLVVIEDAGRFAERKLPQARVRRLSPAARTGK